MKEYNQILQNLKNKVYKPVYCLMGEEPFYIDNISDYIEKNVLTDAEREFNETILYGRDTDAASVIETAKRFPMMANHQVVIVKEAQAMRKIEELEEYVKNPLTTTILVLCYKYKKLDKRKSFAKTVAQKGVLFESKKLYDSQVPDWITNFATGKGYKLSTKAVLLLAEYLGNDLSKIDNELGKLFLNLDKTQEVTPELIEKYIGISKDYNNFELQSALAKGDVLKANRIINYFGKNNKNHPMVVTMSILFNFYSKLLILHTTKNKDRNSLAAALRVSPFFVNEYSQAAKVYSKGKVVQIISLLREYDMRSKGFNDAGTSQQELMKELVYKIMH